MSAVEKRLFSPHHRHTVSDFIARVYDHAFSDVDSTEDFGEVGVALADFNF